jgi:DNA-binding transcriptional regulator YiaG
MTRDLTPTVAAIRRAIEEFGSLAHLADALGVSREEMEDWRWGRAEMPAEKYQQMLELVAGRKRP